MLQYHRGGRALPAIQRGGPLLVLVLTMLFSAIVPRGTPHEPQAVAATSGTTYYVSPVGFDGGPLLTSLTLSSIPSTNAYGLALVSSKVWITNGGKNSVTLVNTNASPSFTGPISITGNGLSTPESLSTVSTGSTRQVWVTNYGNNTISIFDTNGNPIGSPISGNGLASPNGIVTILTSSGVKVWVLNSANNTISQFTSGGMPAGAPISGNGLFNPRGMSVVGQQVWVANDINEGSSISRFNFDGTPAGPPIDGSAGSNLYNPGPMTVVGNHIWVGNSNATIAVYNPDGSYVQALSADGMSSIQGMAVIPSPSGSYVWVASGNVQFFNLDGSAAQRPCSQASPCLSLGYALSKAQPGDTVLVEAGTYDPQTVAASGTALAPITLQAQGSVTITRPLPLTDFAQTIPLLLVENIAPSTSQYLTIHGFTFVGTVHQPGYNAVDAPASGELALETGAAGGHIAVDGNTISDGNGSCLYTFHDPYVSITNNALHGCAAATGAGLDPSSPGGMYITGPHADIENNNISNVYGGAGIQVWPIGSADTPPDVTYATIKNNIVHGNKTARGGVVVGQGDCLIAGNVISGSRETAITAASHCQISANIMYDNRADPTDSAATAIALTPWYTGTDPVGEGGFQIFNNTFFDDGGQSLPSNAAPYSEITAYDGSGTAPGFTQPLTIENNIFDSSKIALSPYVGVINSGPLPAGSEVEHNLYVNARPVLGCSGPTSCTGQNLDPTPVIPYDSDPQFVNPVLAPYPDLHLHAGSPAIGAGTVVGLPYGGTAPDVGALCFNCPGMPTPTPGAPTLTPTAIPSSPTPMPVPSVYQAVYGTVKSQLDSFNASLGDPARDPTYPITIGAFAQLSTIDPISNPTESLQDVIISLDRFKEQGVQGITLDVPYPDLAPSSPSQATYQQYYQSIAAAVRQRKMRLAIELGTSFASLGPSPSNPNFTFPSFAQYESDQHQIAQTIIDTMSPDYLTVANEPDSLYALTKYPQFNPAKGPQAFISFINYVLNGSGGPNSATSLRRGSTKVGAGQGSWSPTAYAQAIAQQTSVDYVDIHVYPVVFNYLQQVLSISDIAKQYGKRVIISETWCEKALASDLTSTSTITGVYSLISRSIYSFWQPIDEEFMAVIMRIAKQKQIDYVSPFFTNYFFSYLDYQNGDENLPYSQLANALLPSDLSNMQADVFSPTGTFYKNLIAWNRVTASATGTPTATATESATVTSTSTPSGAPTSTPTPRYSSTPAPTSTARATPASTVAPSSAHPYQAVTITITNFWPGEPVRVYWDSTSTVPLISSTTSLQSNSMAVALPQANSGTHTLITVGGRSGLIAKAPIQVKPLSLLLPYAGRAGATATGVGFGFAAHEPVALYWDKPFTLLGAGTTNALGSFYGATAITTTIPLSATIGMHYIVAVGKTSHTTSTGGFYVTR